MNQVNTEFDGQATRTPKRVQPRNEWPFGTIPKHWRAVPLKHLCRQFSLYGANIAAAEYQVNGARFIRTSDIRDDGTLEDGGVFLPPQLVADFVLAEGDFLISRSGTVGRAYVYRTVDGVCAYAGYLVRYILRDPETPRWLFYIIKSPGFQQWLGASAIEATIGNVNGEKYANLLVPSPPLPVQRAIVDYLDQETAQIDALVAAKERLLALLAEKRRALITHAVTRGLDPDAPLRESGLPWLGQVPAHWRLAGFTKYLRSLVDYRGKTPEKVPSGVFLVTARNIKDGYIDYEVSQEYVEPDTYDEVMQRGKPKFGDLLLTTEAPLGQAALVDREDIALAQRVIKLDYDPGVLLNEFALVWIRSAPFRWQLNSFATGSTALGIKGERLHMLRNLLPPVVEQFAIVTHIARETAKLDALVAATKRTIALLKERRAALIAAAVTGRIDVMRSDP